MSMRTSGATWVAAVFATAVVMISLGGAFSWAQQITYLARPGEPAGAFPRPKRPVADIVSPSRSTEQQRDAFDESGQIARFLGFRSGMTIGDLGAGSGYHTVRLSRLLGPSFLPAYGGEEDESAVKLISRHEIRGRKLSTVKSGAVVEHGGGLRCITWNYSEPEYRKS